MFPSRIVNGSSDVEGGQRARSIPLRDRRRLHVLSVGLRQHEPVRPVYEPGEDLDIAGRFAAAFGLFGRPFNDDRLTEHGRPLALPNVAAEFTPFRVCRHRARLDLTCQTLRPREQLVPDAVVVKLPVRGGQGAGLGQCGREKLGERCDTRGHGRLRREGQRACDNGRSRQPT